MARIILIGTFVALGLTSFKIRAQTLVNTEDYRKCAERALSPGARAYVESGATELTTYRENMEAFKRYRLRPRFLAQDVSSIDTSTTILGRAVNSPIAICPMSMQRYMNPEGESATASAATDMKIQMVLAGGATTSIETVVRVSGITDLWQQIYILRPLNLTVQWVRRAENAGATAIVVTIDRPHKGVSWSSMRGLFNTTQFNPRKNAPINSFKTRAAVTWDDITWLKGITKLPIILKGVLSGADAEIAVDRGVSAMIVSNHGGRSIDGVPASLEVLPEVVQAVRGRCEVYFDSGTRTGRDIFTALALGARAVFIGRPILYGLACGGQQGVTDVLGLLSNELKAVMASTGCRRVSDIQPSYVKRHQSFYNSPSFESMVSYASVHAASLSSILLSIIIVSVGL